MTATAQSYVSGPSDAPLLGMTIGVQFDRTAARWPDRPGLIVRQQGLRWTWEELAARVDACAAGLLALGLEPGDRIGIWSPNNAEWVVTQFAAAKAGTDPGQHQPGLSPERAGIRAGKSRLSGAGHGDKVQDQRLHGDGQRAGAGTALSQPGRLLAARLPRLQMVIQIGPETVSGAIPFAELSRLGGDPQRRQLADLASTLQFDDAREYSVYVRHDRVAKRRHADAPQYPE